MGDVVSKGLVEEVAFRPGASGLFSISLSSGDKTESYQIFGFEATFTADGGDIIYQDLMAYLAGSAQPVQAVIYQRPDRYMAVTKAEFTRVGS